jgi:putative transposase
MSEDTRDLGKVIEIDEARIKDHLGEIVRGTVEETLNAMLDAEADRICNAKRYERSPDRKDTRDGHYTRKLGTRAGEVTLQVPKLRSLPLMIGHSPERPANARRNSPSDSPKLARTIR